MANRSRRTGGRGWLVLLIILIVIGAGVAGYLAYRAQSRPPQETTTVQRWTCPMHPWIIRDHPGACPICGMTLVPLEQSEPKA